MPQTTLPRQTQDRTPPRGPPPTPQGEPRDGSVIVYTRPQCESVCWLYVTDEAARQMLRGQQKPLPFWIECEHYHGPAHPRMAIRASIHEAPMLVKELPFVVAGRAKKHPLFTALPRMDHHKYPYKGGMTHDRFRQEVQKATPLLFDAEEQVEAETKPASDGASA